MGFLIFLFSFSGGLVVKTEKAETEEMKEIISSVVREDCGTKTEILQEVNEAELLKAQLMGNKLPAGTAASKVCSNEYEYIGCLGSAFKSFEDNVAVYITIDGHVFFRAWSL